MMSLCYYYLTLIVLKNINDSFGHEVGDQLLVQITKRVRDIIRKEDFLFRIGSDEFSIVFSKINGPSDVLTLAKKILTTIKKSFVFKDKTLAVSSSIGLSHFPADGNTTMELYRNADIAMNQAKQRGGNEFQYFTQELHQKMIRQIALSNDILTALKNHELFLVYQPIVDLKTKLIVGAETLMRWKHPTRGLVPPNEFIAIAEKVGAIGKIGDWLITQVCIQIDTWINAGIGNFYITVNLSPLQLINETSVKQLIQRINTCCSCKSHNIPIKFELTESDIVQDEQKMTAALNILHEAGYELLIDDFGTGYSSLSRLGVLHVNSLKIDKSLIDDLPSKPENVKIAKTIIMLAKGLKLDTIAEGIEKEEQFQFLLENGCQKGQGFLFYRPLDPSAFELAILNQNTKASD